MGYSPLVSHIHWSPNYYSGRAYPIRKITIHHMAGNCSIETCGEIFAPTSRQASSNYGVGSDGRVGCYVDEDNTPWTSSSWDNDNQAVTIEVADYDTYEWSPSEAAFNTTMDLCADICKRNDISGLTYNGTPSGTLTEHMMFSSTSCPGPWWHANMRVVCDIINVKTWDLWPDNLNPWDVVNGVVEIGHYDENDRWRAEEELRHLREAEDLKEINIPNGGGNVYRIYNPNTGQHMFTSNIEEHDNLVGVGWESEGTSWKFPPTPSVVYRLFHAKLDDHLFTTNFLEAKAAQEAGYAFEGANFSTASSDGIPIYRVYNPNARQHMYTAKESERDALINSGWLDEGIAFYGSK